ncbi:Protein of unknown function DUF924 [Kalmanozyma brasiliensis GHG001]|uniref:DUF924-domain-containing protein n=1 Tax=Kalmanozyma brasiliensis (strain GHG001) TaxID=1365824 RepID=V5F1I8_KALBG|nr:Protein of unknown function DUF924 [Kalmanozyma brasiliensis GHG001]EST09159.1 Protein of unknown function DUF924 [Kalmanozyma brasiliensis GHG001]
MTSAAASLVGKTFQEILRTPPPAVSAGVGGLIDMALFWKAAGPSRYFAQSEEFDRQLVERYSRIYPEAYAEKLTPTIPSASAETSGESMLAEQHLGMVLLLDQFPRNAFRGSPKQYQSDRLAKKWAEIAIEHGLNRKVDESVELFFYLPWGHSENLEDQDKGLREAERIGGQFLGAAREHREVIARFGRFCHRNEVLGRESTEEEKEWLANEAHAWAKS